MKKIHTNENIVAVQFTQENTPHAVVHAPPDVYESLKALIYQISESEKYVYKVPNAVQADKIVDHEVGAPYSFHLIKKGDYDIVTFQYHSSNVVDALLFTEYFKGTATSLVINKDKFVKVYRIRY
jgi:hypothetical protein